MYAVFALGNTPLTLRELSGNLDNVAVIGGIVGEIEAVGVSFIGGIVGVLLDKTLKVLACLKKSLECLRLGLCGGDLLLRLILRLDVALLVVDILTVLVCKNIICGVDEESN